MGVVSIQPPRGPLDAISRKTMMDNDRFSVSRKSRNPSTDAFATRHERVVGWVGRSNFIAQQLFVVGVFFMDCTIVNDHFAPSFWKNYIYTYNFYLFQASKTSFVPVV